MRNTVEGKAKERGETMEEWNKRMGLYYTRSRGIYSHDASSPVHVP